MNDPWDVKSVRQSGQYISCMKLNGVPLLPPVLSKECRKEMQYYKLLALEVEKRIAFLKPFISESDTDSIEDKTDAPEIPPDFDQLYGLPKEDIKAGFDVTVEKNTAILNEQILENYSVTTQSCTPNLYDRISSNLSKLDANYDILRQSPSIVLDLSLSINDNGKGAVEKIKDSSHHAPQPIDPPERDYNSPKKTSPDKVEKELLVDVDSNYKTKKSKEITEELLSFYFDVANTTLNKSDPLPDMPMEDGPPSLSAKSFTGSLNNIHRESVKDCSKLIRQRSYTVLNPSPQLIAHLKVQSLSTGVDVESISMSESQSNISSGKKRRSWDLESAKVKWSSMALELKQKTVPTVKSNGANRNNFSSKTFVKKPTSPLRPKSVTSDRTRRGSLPAKSQIKSDSFPKPKKSLSPVRNTPSNKTVVKEPINKPNQKAQEPPDEQPPIKDTQNKTLISESDDPAARVRELYEKIQRQQLAQMATLVEKQKREQLLLQQVFEEQNTILYKQLKTICPKSPVEVKEAWGDKLPDTTDQADHGPVSLSQLINHKSDVSSSPLSSTLTDTHNHLNKADAVLRKSKDISASIKKQYPRQSPGTARTPSPTPLLDGSRTRTHSPNPKHTSASRRLTYDTSTSSDREFEPISTDRTNDTMAGLNVSFPTDSEDCPVSYNSGASHCGTRDVTMIHCPVPTMGPRSATDNAICSMEDTIHKSIRTMPGSKQRNPFNCQPTPQQLSAASTIVAYAKGYLVRRLMRTERVQATVQTIKDALLCALQLHQDRAGIRGADVDLHRRLIQQITAACYSLHDTFVASSAADRCALIAADRERRRQKPIARHYRQKTDIMSQSHSGSFPTRAHRPSSSLMTQSNYETFSGEKTPSRRYMPSPRRRPWR